MLNGAELKQEFIQFKHKLKQYSPLRRQLLLFSKKLGRDFLDQMNDFITVLPTHSNTITQHSTTHSITTTHQFRSQPTPPLPSLKTMLLANNIPTQMLPPLSSMYPWHYFNWPHTIFSVMHINCCTLNSIPLYLLPWWCCQLHTNHNAHFDGFITSRNDRWLSSLRHIINYFLTSCYMSSAKKWCLWDCRQSCPAENWCVDASCAVSIKSINPSNIAAFRSDIIRFIPFW